MKSDLRIWIPRVSIIAAAVIFIVVGIVRQEQLAVLKKAINICLECIGIG